MKYDKVVDLKREYMTVYFTRLASNFVVNVRKRSLKNG